MWSVTNYVLLAVRPNVGLLHNYKELNNEN